MSEQAQPAEEQRTCTACEKPALPDQPVCQEHLEKMQEALINSMMRARKGPYGY